MRSIAKLIAINFLNSDSQERGRHLPQRRVDDLSVIQISPDHDDRGIGFSTTSRTAADHHSSSHGESADYPSCLMMQIGDKASNPLFCLQEGVSPLRD